LRHRQIERRRRLAPVADLCVSREHMKVFLAIAGLWGMCFVLLFLFYFVPDFYVLVGSGPASWKKPMPLSFEERLTFSFIAATLIAAVAGVVAGLVYCVYKATLWLRKARA